MPAQPKNRQPRRAVSKDTAKPVLVYFPTDVVTAVDALVIREDTDRSKWIRQAIREALIRRNISA